MFLSDCVSRVPAMCLNRLTIFWHRFRRAIYIADGQADLVLHVPPFSPAYGARFDTDRNTPAEATYERDPYVDYEIPLLF